MFPLKFSTLLLVCCIAFLGNQSFLYGQGGKYGAGARSVGMATASVTLEDGWSVFNNPAGIGAVESPTALIGYQNRYGLSSLNSFSAAYVQPFNFGSGAITAWRFGDDLFSEQKLGLAFGDRIGIVALGGMVNYIQMRIEGLGTKGVVAVEFGGIVTFGENFSFGAHISNINQAKISDFENEKLPTVMKAGLSYRPFESLMINAEVEKDLDFEEVIKVGLEYNFYKQFYARTGFLTEPFQAHFGLGFKPNRFVIDYAFGNNSTLGDIHELSVAYAFQKK